MATQDKGAAGVTPAVADLLAAFAYDPETGAIVRVRGAKNACVYESRTGAKRLFFQKRKLLAHRVAWAMYHGRWPVGEIDHINGVQSDNRIANLRDVDSGVNQQNRRKAHRTNKVGVLGVHATYQSGSVQYRARIMSPGERRQIYLGSFATAEEANAAYVAAKRELHPGCTL